MSKSASLEDTETEERHIFFKKILNLKPTLVMCRCALVRAYACVAGGVHMHIRNIAFLCCLDGNTL